MRTKMPRCYTIKARVTYPCYGKEVGDEMIFTIISSGKKSAINQFEKYLNNSEAPNVDFVSIESSFLFLLPNWAKKELLNS